MHRSVLSHTIPFNCSRKHCVILMSCHEVDVQKFALQCFLADQQEIFYHNKFNGRFLFMEFVESMMTKKPIQKIAVIFLTIPTAVFGKFRSFQAHGDGAGGFPMLNTFHRRNSPFDWTLWYLQNNFHFSINYLHDWHWLMSPNCIILPKSRRRT